MGGYKCILCGYGGDYLFRYYVKENKDVLRRPGNNAKWTWFAIGYQCGLAYAVALMVYQIGSAFTGNLNIIGLLVAALVLAGMVYMLFRPYTEATKLARNVKVRMARKLCKVKM